MAQSAASFLDDPPVKKQSAGSFLEGTQSASSFLEDKSPLPGYRMNDYVIEPVGGENKPTVVPEKEAKFQEEIIPVPDYAKLGARGATSEGIYSAIEGGARALKNSPATLDAIGKYLEGDQRPTITADMPEDVQAMLMSEWEQRRKERNQQINNLPVQLQNIQGGIQHYIDQVAQLRGDIRDALPVNQEVAQSIPGQVAQGVGQMATSLPLMVLPPVAAAAGAGQLYDEGYNEAKSLGLSDEQANLVASKYAAVATPIDFLSDKLIAGRLGNAITGKSRIRKIISDLIASSASGGASEGAQQVALNAIVDPDRPILQDVGQSALVGALVPAFGAGVSHGIGSTLQARLSDKTPEQQVKTLRDEVAVAEDKSVADALTDAADAIERDIQAAKLAEDQKKAAAKAQQDQIKAAEEQQKQAVAAQQQAQEIPKSAQILAEPTKTPVLANVATEVGTQTSPYALQGKLNEMTAPLPQIAPVAPIEQQPAQILSGEQLEGRKRASAMRRSRDDGPVIDEITEPVEPVNNAKANFERRKALFDAQKRAEKEAAEAARVAQEEAADEAKWLAEQQEQAAKEVKRTQIKEAVDNPDTQYQFTVQQGGEGYPGYVQVDAILPSLSPGERNTVSSNISDLNKAGAKLPDVPEWVPSGRYTLEQLNNIIQQGEPKRALQKQSPDASVFLSQEPEVGLPQVGEGNAQPEVSSGNISRQETISESTLGPDNRYKLIKDLNESKLLALANQLGVDPKGMSGERLKSRLSSNASEEAITEALANPAPLPPNKGKIRGSKADKWADKKIREGGQTLYSGIDPELAAAYVIKLVGDLEHGAVTFADWSKRVIAEAGESIRPHLQAIWDRAMEQMAARSNQDREKAVASGQANDGSQRAESDSSLGKYVYPKTTNAARIETADTILKYVNDTGDFQGGFERLQSIADTGARATAAAKLLVEANKIQDDLIRGPLTDKLFAEVVSTEAAQRLQIQGEINDILTPVRPYLAWRGLIQSKINNEVASNFDPDSAKKINEGMKEAGNEAAGAINGAVEGKSIPPELKLVNKIASDVNTPGYGIDPNLGESVMQRIRKSAGYREFFTKRGTKELAGRLWQLLSGANNPEGNVWTFDSIVTSELGRILDEQLKKAGIEPQKNNGISTPEKMAQFLSNDPLRSDKVKAIDNAVRAEIEKRSPEEVDALSELWDATVGAMANSPASDTMARRIIQEELKSAKVKWNDVFKHGGKSISDLRERIINAVSDKVSSVSPGGENLNLVSFRQQIGSVFDTIAGVRKAAYEKNKALAAARAKSMASPQEEASRLLNQFAKIQSDTQAWSDKTSAPVKAALSDFISGKIDSNGFLVALDYLGVKRATSETLLSVADRQKEVRDTWKKIEDSEKLLKSLEKDGALLGPIQKIASSLGVNWNSLFTNLPEIQDARKQEILSRLNSDPKFAGITESSKAKLVNSLNKAWETLRLRAFRREFEKLINLPNLGPKEQKAIENAQPKLTQLANLGLLDNEAFLNAMAEQYGIEGMDGATGKRLRELGQKAARTPEGVERNAVNEEIKNLLMDAKGIDPGSLLKDFWYRNVMSAPRTGFEILSGGIVNGMARTFTTAIDTAIAHRRPDIAMKLIGLFFKDATMGVRFGADLLASGDRTIMPRYNQKFIEAMKAFQAGKSPGGELAAIYRRSSGLKKAALYPHELLGRLLEALDYVGAQGIRQQQMIYAGLTRKDQKSFDAAMRRFNKEEVAKAEEQAKRELGPSAHRVKVIARAREILNQGIEKEIVENTGLMTEVAALNNVPFGIAGSVYRAINGIKGFNIAKYPLGAAFLKAGLNLFQESTNWAPGTGQINALRAMWRNPSKDNPFRSLALDDIPPEQARHIIVAQTAGLMLAAAAARFFLGEKPEDKEGKPRQWEISGGWQGLSPTQKKALMDAGERPYMIRMPSGRAIDYKLTPFFGALAMIGHQRDQQRFNKANLDETSVANQVMNGWLSGMASVKDLSVASQMSNLAGIMADDTRAPDAASLEKKVADALTSSGLGLVPFSSAVREFDAYIDQQRYRADRKNPGIDMWLQKLPFARRSVGEGPMINSLGDPIEVVTTPFNRHIGELPKDDPVYRALSDKIASGMKMPALTGNRQIVVKDGDKITKREMTPEEAYEYEKAVRQGFKRQLEMDLSAFEKANPDQASAYAQEAFGRIEQYVSDRMNLGKPVGDVQADPKISSALSPEFSQIKEFNADEASASKMARSRLRVEYDRVMSLPANQRLEEIRKLAVEDQPFARKLLKYASTPAAERTALEKSVAGLEADTRAEYYLAELAKRKTPDEKRAYLNEQAKANLISKEVLKQMERSIKNP